MHVICTETTKEMVTFGYVSFFGFYKDEDTEHHEKNASERLFVRFGQTLRLLLGKFLLQSGVFDGIKCQRKKKGKKKA